MNLVDILALIWLLISFGSGARLGRKALALISWIPGIGLVVRLAGGVLGGVAGAALFGIGLYYALLQPTFPTGLADTIHGSTVSSWLLAFGALLVTLWS